MLEMLLGHHGRQELRWSVPFLFFKLSYHPHQGERKELCDS